MSAATGTPGAHVAPLQAALLDDPIAFLWAEHARQRVLLGHLERIARAPAARGARHIAAALHHWLTRELPTHIADEEFSLYPRLRPIDEAGVLARLSEDHVRDRAPARRIAEGLAAIGEGRDPPRGFVQEALRFVSDHRDHLTTEERLVTPLARRALDPAAAAALGAEMAERRQASKPGRGA